MMSFASDMDRLQQIADSFENDSMDIDSALVLFEEGTRLVRACREHIETARRRVTALMDDGKTESDIDDER